MTQIEWARAVAEHPDGHSRADVERACSVLAEQLAKVERAAREHLTTDRVASVAIIDGMPRFVVEVHQRTSTRERLADLVGVKLGPPVNWTAPQLTSEELGRAVSEAIGACGGRP